jgi:hypothetical protein
MQVNNTDAHDLLPFDELEWMLDDAVVTLNPG